MPSRLSLFDHHCLPLTEIKAPTTPRSWVLDGYGRCEFSVSTADPKCTEANLQYGNLIYIEHIPSKDEGGVTHGQLPAWVGMILPPRKWDLGVLNVVAYSAEAILAYRAMPFQSIKGTPATLFKGIIEFANKAAGNIPFHLGVVEDKAAQLGADLRLSAYDHIQTIAKTAGMNWNVTAEIDTKGRLQLYANLYKAKGTDTGLILTNTNSELENPLLTEQGSPSNEVFGYTQANTPQSRQYARGAHQAAIDDYGPLQANQTFMGLRDAAGVAAAAQQLAGARGRPVKLVHRVALDRAQTLSALDTGNRVTVKDANAGFSPNGGFGFEVTARILSLDYNDLSNKCPLNLEVLS